MQDKVLTSATPRTLEGARDLQAKLYREIGISAVAAALHSINKPEPNSSVLSVGSQTDRAMERLVRVA